MRPGSGEEYGESSAGIMAMLKEIGYPYPVYGHRVIMGEENLAYFVILHDGLGNFYGEKDFGNYLQAAGAGEKWSAHMDARGSLVFRNDMFQSQFRKDLSYTPQGE